MTAFDAGRGTVCSVAELIGRTAEPQDSLKYACMGLGFSHKPLPVVDGKRVSKRLAFCSICKAPRCVHHHHLTPAEVRRTKHIRGEPIEDWE